MNKVAVITATRAEFGLLLPLINRLREKESDSFKVELLVTGTHLSKAYGYTIDEIKSSGIRIDDIIEIPVNSNNATDISHNQAVTLERFTNKFCESRYDGVVILGDRYEMLSVAIAASNTRTPIFHLCGGDTTEGAMDEWIRHSITKMSYLHFVTNEGSKKRVIQMGEDPSRVFNYGSTSIDNIFSQASLSRDEVLESIGINVGDYFVCTYHPVTLDTDDSIEVLVNDYIAALASFPEIDFIITKSNADEGGAKINELLDCANSKYSNIHVYSSLGVKRYLSLMKYSKGVIGNSSSGIIEAPSFGIPTINIGDRQRGRLQVESIINCKTSKEDIIYSIKKATSDEMSNFCKKVKSPYGDGHAAERIENKIYDIICCGECIDLKKKFYEEE